MRPALQSPSLPSRGTSSANRILAIILISYFMLIMDTSIVITALPKIRADLGFSAADLAWVHNAYTLFFGGFLLLGARAGDLLGRRRMYMVGIIVFTVASCAIAVSQSLGVLLVSRALQGLGAAILAPATLALLQTNFPEGKERTRAVAYYGATSGLGGSVGIVAGGMIAEMLSWRVGFWVNLPIGIAMILMARRFIHETPRMTGHFDVTGAVTSTLGVGSLVFGFIHAAKAGWGDPTALAALATGVILLGFLVLHEARAPQPILPLRLLMHRVRAAAYVARMLFLGAMIGFWFFTTQYLQGVLGFGPFHAGLAFLPMTVVNFIVATRVPRLTQSLGNTRLLVVGLAITAAGIFWLSRASVGGTYWLAVALPMTLVGIGQGACLSPLTAAGITGVAPADAGAAAGLVNVAHQLGGSIGLSILVVIFAAAPVEGLDATDALARQISWVHRCGAGMLILAVILVVTLVLGRRVARKAAPLVEA